MLCGTQMGHKTEKQGKNSARSLGQRRKKVNKQGLLCMMKNGPYTLSASISPHIPHEYTHVQDLLTL